VSSYDGVDLDPNSSWFLHVRYQEIAVGTCEHRCTGERDGVAQGFATDPFGYAVTWTESFTQVSTHRSNSSNAQDAETNTL
jgi:hypothetical protein